MGERPQLGNYPRGAGSRVVYSGGGRGNRKFLRRANFEGSGGAKRAQWAGTVRKGLQILQISGEEKARPEQIMADRYGGQNMYVINAHGRPKALL